MDIWYANTAASNMGGTPIGGAVGAIYAAPADVEGVYCYYVVVTNTIEDNGDGGRKAISIASNAAILSVGGGLVNAQIPNITAQPASAAVTTGEPHELTVSAVATGGGELSYQWYVSVTADNTAGAAIPGATGAAYTVSIDAEVTLYYYVVVTNAIDNNGDGGYKTASTVSAPAALKASILVAALSQARTVPKSGTPAGTAVLAPIVAPVGNFAVGPNPAVRGGAVSFFYGGKKVSSGVLVIFDAGGNVVKKLKIASKPLSGDSARHCVASWDLTDKKSRPVAAGAYLAKGVLSASGGVRERVSAVVLVR